MNYLIHFVQFWNFLWTQLLQHTEIIPSDTDPDSHTDLNTAQHTPQHAQNNIQDTTLASASSFVHLFPDLTLPNQQLVAVILYKQRLANLVVSFTQTSTLPPEVTAHDRTFRLLMTMTGFWPPNLDINADLLLVHILRLWCSTA